MTQHDKCKIPEKRRNILKAFEEKAIEEIGGLDEIINGIIN